MPTLVEHAYADRTRGCVRGSVVIMDDVRQRLAGHVSITTTMHFYVSVLDEDMDLARTATENALAGMQDARRAHKA